MNSQINQAQLVTVGPQEKWQIPTNKLNQHAVQVHKFGGSSLASIESIERVISIVQQNCKLADIVVVSANGQTTDKLLAIYQLAQTKSEQLHQAIDDVETDQRGLITGLLSKQYAEALLTQLHTDITLLVQWLQVDINAHYSDLLALGELWSARLLSAVLNETVCPSIAIDAREFLYLDTRDQSKIDYLGSQERLSHLLPLQQLAVITGYIARNEQGQPCTLGRNGSDYSATIIAHLTQAQNVTLWTDVDGIYSADPRLVPNARKLHRVPRAVAKELGRLGNPVLHEKTLQPLNNCGSHLHIASSFDALTVGTEVGDFGQIAKQELAVTHLNDLLLAQSPSFVGESGKQAFKELSAISLDATQGLLIIKQEQQKSVSQWLASTNTQVKFTPVSIIAVVGHEVTTRANVNLRFKRALKGKQVIATLASDNQHSLVAVMPQPCSAELLNHVHHGLTKNARHIGLFIAGIGNIGERFLALLPKQIATNKAFENLHLIGLASSKKILIDADGIEPNLAYSSFEQEAQAYQAEQLLAWAKNHPFDELVLVDITPSEQFSLLYHDFFKLGTHVIGANKWAASSSKENYQALLTQAQKNNCIWLGNTTVGAGLPINHAIDELLKSGDEIQEISGIFSGTLSWLFEHYDGEQPFDALLKQALSEGLTEPDPRDDLSGLDVQRKLLILARLAGFTLSLEDIECQNLVPESLQGIDKQEFLLRSTALNDYFSQQHQQANAQGACIRYVARFNNNAGVISAKVSLETLSNSDPFASLTPCDNIFKIVSSWYQDNPLLIRGPGAGRDVTAGGLHSDLVKVCSELNNKPHQVNLKGINE